MCNCLQSSKRLWPKREVLTRNSKNFYRALNAIFVRVKMNIYLRAHLGLLKSKNNILTQVAFSEPFPAFLYGP